MRRRLTLFHLSSIFYRLCGGAAIVFQKAALPNLCAATTIPHSSFLTPNFSKPHPFARSLATDTRGGAAIPLKAQGTRLKAQKKELRKEI